MQTGGIGSKVAVQDEHSDEEDVDLGANPSGHAPSGQVPKMDRGDTDGVDDADALISPFEFAVGTNYDDGDG
jgi:hypothetical protein